MSGGPAAAVRRPHAGTAVLWIYAVGVYLFLLAPILVVLIEAFSASDLMLFPPRAWSFRWFVAFAGSTQFLQSFRLSLGLALVTAALATAIGTPAGYGIVRIPRLRASGLQTLLLAPLYTPAVLIGMALLITLSMVQLAGSLAGLAAAHLLITIPYVVRTVTVSVQGTDPMVEDAARTLGATPWQTFVGVTLPLIRSGVFAGAVFAFTISFSDIYMALFLAGPRTTTLPLRIFNYLEWQQTPLVAAASAAQVGVIIALCVLIEKAAGFARAGRL